ncbi:MAG: DoxX family protein [Acidobacteria bacterium]|nr:DoxX family protein [Acidobacteriota bacterium]
MALRLFGWVCRLVLGGLLVFAGYTKLRNLLLFEMAVDTYRLLSPAGVIVVARTLPWLEVGLGALLLSGWKMKYVSSFTALLLGGFLLTMVITYSRGIDANCGCFGFGERISTLTLARDSVLFAMAVFLAAWSWRQQSSASAGRLPG